jgi:predicted transcriptional regulator
VTSPRTTRPLTTLFEDVTVSALLGSLKLLLRRSTGPRYISQTKFGNSNLEEAMGRPAKKELTERELEVMHVFWKRGELTAIDAREELARRGVDRAYVTVANLVRILVEKGFLRPTNEQRPFRYRPVRTFDQVSQSLVGDLMKRVFQGSREQLLVHVLSRHKKLTARERRLLEQVLEEQS